MSLVRQLPALFLRGSLANQTMANLTKAQRDHVDKVFDYVINHAEMQRHRHRVMKELSVTIAGDYKDDRRAAEQEFEVAVWRGVVNLFCHRKYTYKCLACGQDRYTTKRGRPKMIDRVQSPCPNCKMIKVVEAGETNVAVGAFMTHEEFQATYADFSDYQIPPKSVSPIIAIPGQMAYANPQQIIDDPKQLRKFFGEFVWNYFRQQINENPREEHRKEAILLVGNTDYLITHEIMSVCNRMKVDYSYCDKMEPMNGRYTIRINGLLTPPEFTAEFAQLKAKAELYGVPVHTTTTTIEVMVSPDAGQMPMLEKRGKNGRTERWQVEYYRPEHVNVLDSFNKSDDQDSDHTISQTSHRTVGGERMDLEDHVTSVDNSEVMHAVREAIPDGHCKDVFDILRGLGDVYDAFSQRYGDGEPRINHIASFLGITARAVNQHKQTIMLCCMANNFVPCATS